jgi:hypothetical protein
MLVDAQGRRSGVSQYQHLHKLMAKGVQLCEEYMPGYSKRVDDLGACRPSMFNTKWVRRFKGLVAHAHGLISRRHY